LKKIQIGKNKMSDPRETLYGKGDLRRPRDEGNWSKGFDAIKWTEETERVKNQTTEEWLAEYEEASK
jgi:hypothetical protein